MSVRRLSALVLLCLGVGCSTPPESVYSGSVALLVRAPLPTEGPDRERTTLKRAWTQSLHLLRIRGTHDPLVHRDHEKTLTFIRGKGLLRVRGERIEFEPGTVVYVPQGAAHEIEVAPGTDAVAYELFVPSFDGDDEKAPGKGQAPPAEDYFERQKKNPYRNF